MLRACLRGFCRAPDGTQISRALLMVNVGVRKPASRAGVFLHPKSLDLGDADMKSEIADEILEELGSTFQKLETQCAALLEFVKDKGIVNEDELAPYMERAAAASAVRWRGTQVRMARLLASAASGDGDAKDRDKKKPEESKSAQGDEHSKDEGKETVKQAESLAKGPVEAQAEGDSEKQKKGTSEKPVQKDSKSQELKEKEAGSRPRSREQSGEAAKKSTGDADQASERKEGQAAATRSRNVKSSGQPNNKRENKDHAA
jgi:hypothetical protein